MLAFLADMIEKIPAERLLKRLQFTPFDELMIIDLASDTYEGRYHADGKFFSPAMSAAYSQLLEYTSRHMVHPEDREKHLRLMDGATMEQRLREAVPRGILSGEIRYLGLDGNWKRMQHLLLDGETYGLKPHTVCFYLYDMREIYDREHGQLADAAATAEHLRVLMPEMLSEASFFSMADKLLSREKRQWCMVAVDVKHYKLFRELNGQEKGERLLIRFGEILHRMAEDEDGLACYRGQDDFGLLIPFEQSRIDRLFSELLAEIETLTSTSGFFPILGICLADEEDIDAVEVFNRAALTAEEIKDDLRYHIRVYDPELHERHVEEFRLLAEFNEALEKDEILFYLQPQVDVVTGRIVGAESLARWQKEDGSFVSPARFVPVLEKYGVVTELDARIWEQVCAWMRELLDRGIQPVPISVNISRINIFSVDVPGLLSNLVEKYGLTPELLKVEITESAYVDDSKRIQETIFELRKRGFRVMMDDFGSGYSSLNMLRTISVDVIKLDAQFLRFSMGEEQKGVNILESIISMTKSLSTPMIVEGVETRELVQFLKDMGCRYMQGFYYYRPMMKRPFEELLQDPDRVDHKGIILLRNQQVHAREFLDEHIYSDAMLNNILGPVAFYGRRGKNIDILRYNQQFVDLIGLDPDVLEERRYHIQQFFHPDDLEKFYMTLEEAARDKINGASGIFRIYKPNGTMLWMQLHVYLLQEEAEEQVFYGSARDMTELQYINMDLPGGYYRSTIGGEYEFLYISQTMLRMLGYTREEITLLFGDKMERMIHPDDREMVRRESEQMLAGNLRELSPYRILHRDGKYRYVMDQSRVTDQYGELCWQSVIMDITEVMTLRNRMRLLEKYSTDCVVFIHDFQHPETLELACYGLEEALGLNQEEFLRQLTSRTISILDKDGEELFGQMSARYEEVSALNGRYTLIPENGRKVPFHVRFSRIREREQDVECIVSFTTATGV